VAELAFDCTGARPDKFAVAPSMSLSLKIAETTGQHIDAIALRCQIRIEPARRRYTASEAERLNDLFGDTEHAFAAFHLHPDIVGMHSGGNPEHDQIVQEIGAFADHRFRLALHGVDYDLDRLFGEFFGHFGAPGAHQLGRPRFRGIGQLRRDHGVVETGDRISHAGTISYSQTKFG